MYRPIIHFLKQWFIEEQEVSHYMLDGMPSSGKSIAMAALVHWARLSGWVVCSLLLYLSGIPLLVKLLLPAREQDWNQDRVAGEREKNCKR